MFWIGKNMQTNNFEKLFEEIKLQLKNKSLTIYKAVDRILESSDEVIPQLQSEILNGNKPYYRLFAAWCLGKVDKSQSKDILEKAYLKENDNNVRANIAWAYLRQNKTRKNMYTHFLTDRYFLIKLLALKRIGTHHILKPSISILGFLKEKEHPLVRIEAIRKSHFFIDDPAVMFEHIKDILFRSENVLEMEACLKAIGNSCNVYTLNVLIDFYNKKRSFINKFQNVAVAFCRAISDNNESAAYEILIEIYFEKSTSEFVKYCAIEALAVGGGPNSHEALLSIYKKERNNNIRSFVKILKDRTEITDL